MSENKLYEGKAKILYSTGNDNEIIQYFKDDATAFNNQKKDVISSKGILNNYISEFIMLELTNNDIPTHFIKRLDERRQLVKKCTIIPLEVIIRNTTAGSMAKRLGIEEGIDLKNPVLDLCYKKDELGDPLINDDHAVEVLHAVAREQLSLIKKLTFRINDILQKIFLDIGIKLVDFKIEFGFDSENNILLADEISPDSCRLWDINTNNKLDKDRFRRGLGGLVEAYTEVANRLHINIK
ncbi:MAG: phosphoribosylaminoimidazolesuccinocarboxamide synthase [Rickettsiales bacterium]|nr:phosphoribosylaminoimidazolesuccinocarboxamide synthase [Rickettsiales bacterium]